MIETCQHPKNHAKNINSIFVDNENYSFNLTA